MMTRVASTQRRSPQISRGFWGGSWPGAGGGGGVRGSLVIGNLAIILVIGNLTINPLADKPGGTEDDRQPARSGCIMTITPLGDQAVLAGFAAESDALRFATAVRAAGLPGGVDVVTADFPVSVFYDMSRIRYVSLAADLERLHNAAKKAPLTDSGRLHVIPCCYALGPDLDRVAELTRLSTAEVIRLHSESEYTV